MVNISSWILSITGIILIGLIIEIVLPNGKTSKLIKSILTIFSIFLFVSPLKNLDVSKLDFSSLFNDEILINDEFIQNREQDKLKVYENSIENNLTENGYLNVEVKMLANFKNENIKIDTVFVDLRKLVLTDEKLNIDKYTNIVAIIKSTILIDEEQVVFYE